MVETHLAQACVTACVVADAGKPDEPGVHAAESDFGIVRVRRRAVGLGEEMRAAKRGPIGAVC